MSKTVPEKVNERMANLQKARAEELSVINSRNEEIEKNLVKIARDREAATLNLDTATFKEALKAEADSKAELKMYKARYHQLEGRNLVTEEESDSTIKELLAYEDAREMAFLEAIKEPVKQLYTMIMDYKKDIDTAEQTIKAWTSQVHANYYDYNSNQRRDHPVPVHVLSYGGCAEAVQLLDVLEDIYKKN